LPPARGFAGDQLTEPGQVTFSVTLAQVHRQIRHQLCKERVLAIRPGTDRTAHVVHHLCDRVLDSGPRPLGPRAGLGLGLPVAVLGAGAQYAGGRVQRTVDGAQVGEGMGLGALGALFTQHFCQALGGAIPARGNPYPALPEAWTAEVVTRMADQIGRASCRERV